MTTGETPRQTPNLPAKLDPKRLPPLQLGRDTPEVRRQVYGFYSLVAEVFERWVAERPSPHTQRARRDAVMNFVHFVRIPWPDGSWELLTASVKDVTEWRDWMIAESYAPKTIDQRIAYLSSFYRFVARCAEEERLPISPPNPAHISFVKRVGRDPVHEREALSLVEADKLRNLPDTSTVLGLRDKAILDVFLFTGARIATVCRLNVGDFGHDDADPKLTLHHKSNKRKTVGIHQKAAASLTHYLEASGVTRGPLFRAKLNPRSKKLGNERISISSMKRILEEYLRQLSKAVRPLDDAQPGQPSDRRFNREKTTERLVFTPHSLRATTATLLLDAGVDIMEVKELLGHELVATTQIYDKRRKATRESASHKMPL